MIGGGDVAELQPDRPRGLAQRARGLRHSLTQNIDTTTPSGKLIAFRFCAKRYPLWTTDLLTEPAADETLTEIAASLSFTFDDAIDSLRRVARLLDKIADLAPD